MVKLSVIGITESPNLQLPPEALAEVKSCDIIIGAPRHLKKASPFTEAKQIIWASPLSKTYTQIKTLMKQGKKIAVLATGDPMFFGIGATLVRQFGSANIKIFASVGAFASATASLGWAANTCDFTTLHGRPIESLRKYLKPQARLLILSHDKSTPAKVVDYLNTHNFGKSEMSVLCDMGAKNESIHHFKNLNEVKKHKFSNLNTIALSLQGSAQSLTDESLQHDGLITKEEIRAITMLRLNPYGNAHLWDLGAGCGSISIAFALAGGTVSAIESNAKRIAMIQNNACNWGVEKNISIIKGDIAKSISGKLPSPDAIFWGGGIDSIKTLDKSYNLLKKRGIFVANAVTSEAIETLLAFRKKHGGNISRIQTERLEAIGSKHSFTPARAIYQYWVQK